ncbi:MAG TPA: DUF1674 domain-containing protein [Gammaproteobacteria bacterium]|jgi:hypothetical protein|nr:DUF1674 domain-containing protein [Gammaproteobacteria bacterium]
MDDSVKNEPNDPERSSDATDRHDDAKPVKEHGGPKGPEPTRYGDWEKKGRCIDF